MEQCVYVESWLERSPIVFSKMSNLHSGGLSFTARMYYFVNAFSSTSRRFKQCSSGTAVILFYQGPVLVLDLGSPRRLGSAQGSSVAILS